MRRHIFTISSRCPDTCNFTLYYISIPPHSSRSEDIEHNPVPQIQAVPWPVISMSVVLPELCAEVDEVEHGTKASCPLLMGHVRLIPQGALAKL